MFYLSVLRRKESGKPEGIPRARGLGLFVVNIITALSRRSLFRYYFSSVVMVSCNTV